MQTINYTPDWSLLSRYVKTDSQEAFATLVARHLNLVNATALREVGDAGTAEDVTQAVFLLLARKAPALRAETHISGWLFQTARFASKNARTRDMRRRKYEQQAAQMQTADKAAKDAAFWNSFDPWLNDALARLPGGDREALLLRYWDSRLAKTGAALGVSEEAARKRVARALEKLRRLLGGQGISIPAVALEALLPSRAVSAAPAALAPLIGRMTVGIIAGHVPVGLVSSSVSQLSEGVLQAMKIAHVKTIALITAAGLVGFTTFAVASQYKNVRLAGTTAQQQPEWKPLPEDTFPAETSGQALASEQIAGRCRQAYDALQTYQVKVKVSSHGLVGPTQQSVVSHTSADIAFERPGKICATATTTNEGLPMPAETYAYVSNGPTTYLKDTITGTGWQKAQDTDEAIASFQGVAEAAISALPAVLLDTQTYNPFFHALTYDPVVHQGTLDGDACYLVTASSKTGTRTVSEAFYIDKKTFLLRELVTDSVGVVNALSKSVVVRSHNVQVYQNEKINAPISESVFATPPGS